MHDEEYPFQGCLASNPFPRYSGQFNGHLLFNTDLEELHQYLPCGRIKYRETGSHEQNCDKSLVSVEARIFVPDRRPFSYLSQPSCNLYSFIKREGYGILASLTCSKLDSWRYAYNAFETPSGPGHCHRLHTRLNGDIGRLPATFKAGWDILSERLGLSPADATLQNFTIGVSSGLFQFRFERNLFALESSIYVFTKQ
jgi:hypothetical protein